MNQLRIERLSLTYPDGVKALDNISLEISNGMFGLLGPNGAGKSTLMKTIVGLQKPGQGTITFNGTDVVLDPGYLRRQLGFLPQDFGVYPRVSAYSLLQHLALLKGIGNAGERHTQILALLKKVNLLEVKDKEVHTFSGGMKQRFGVAQTLLGNPKIIIVDEPTAGLDPEERSRFNALLSEISEQVIVLLSTHLVEDVRNLCSRMAIIRNGAICAAGNPAAMVAQLEGKIWTGQITRSSLHFYESMYAVIGRQLVEKKLHLTVYSDARPEGFQATSPGLEHLYFYTLHQS